MELINNKEKQYKGGNWGHPRKFTKKNTKIDDPLIPARGKRRSKKKREKKVWTWCACPFCGKEIPIDENYTSTKSLVIFKPRKKECVCGAKVTECPCCQRETWVKDGIHKHYNNVFNCGFTGKKLNRRLR